MNHNSKSIHHIWPNFISSNIANIIFKNFLRAVIWVQILCLSFLDIAKIEILLSKYEYTYTPLQKGVEECVTNQIILSPSLKNHNLKFWHFLAQFMHAGFPLLGYWVSVNFVREGLKKCGICRNRMNILANMIFSSEKFQNT